MQRLATFAFALLLLGATKATAQPPGSAPDAPPPRVAPAGSPDFLFGPPHGSLGVRGSWMFASAGSDLFDFVRRHLTVDKDDFNAPAFGFDLAVMITPRVDVMVGFDAAQTSTDSEYRDFVDNQSLPINQNTSLSERNVFGSIRFNLRPRGESVSRFAWVPRTVTPFVGAGAGLAWYRFEQQGDFVDFVDLDVFPDYFKSQGYAPSVHVFGGADVRIYRALFLSFEGKYMWANATLGSDFVDFDPIDLGGLRLSTGVNVLF